MGVLAGEMGRHPAGTPGSRFPEGPAWGHSLHSKSSGPPSPLHCGPRKPLRDESNELEFKNEIVYSFIDREEERRRH